MFQRIDIYSVNRMTYGISNVLITTVIKGLLVFAVVYAVVSAEKRLPPAHRHLFWLFATASCLLAPALSYVALPVRVIDGAFLTENRGAFQGALSALVQWFFPFKFKTVWQMESGSYFCINKVTRLQRLSWESWAAIVWGGGALYSLATIVAANLRLLRLAKKAVSAPSKAHAALFRELARSAGIRGSVRLLFSGRCRVPFAWGVFRPAVFLPEAARRWPDGRLRAVLTHELAHVKRRDYLTQLVSRIVCSLLWFVPFVWVSHSNLHDEQEQACDEAAVREGTESAEYAGHLLALARSLTRSDAVLAGIFLSRSHRSSLEKRVATLLARRNAPRLRPLASFARPFVVCVVLSLPLLLLNPAVSEAKRSYIDTRTALGMLTGVWINREYSITKSPPLPPKYVVTPDGKTELWGRLDNFGPSYRMDLEIVRSWVGRDGCLYCDVYQIHPTIKIDSSTELWRVDRTGKVLETMYRGGIDYRHADEFPEILDPTPDPRSPDNYAVWYRE